MKLGKIILGASMIIDTASFAQDGVERECLRMKKIANDAMAAKNYVEATDYFLRGEKICGDFDAPNYGRLTGSIMRVIRAEKDPKIKALYADTLVQVWDRMDSLGLYDHKTDMKRAHNFLQCVPVNKKEADFFFKRGVKEQGTAVTEGYLGIYYYNTYLMYTEQTDPAKKSEMKVRLINDYFDLTDLITKANFSIKTQEGLTGIFNSIVQSCDDLTPEIAGFIETLSEDPEVAKASLIRLMTLMEKLKCTDSDEYMALINKYLELDPESPFALEMKGKSLEREKKYREANAIYEQLIGLEEVTTERKNELKYRIVYNLFIMGATDAAYKKAMSTQGASRGKCLAIAAQCVAKKANKCGDSTFERKCNYIYAVQLCEKAGAPGAKYIAGYKANYPTTQECFAEGNPTSVKLVCWGVTVSPCN